VTAGFSSSTSTSGRSLVRQTETLRGLDRLVHLAGVSPTMDNAERILEVDLAGTAALAALTAVRPG
jgi:hypothetical protein